MNTIPTDLTTSNPREIALAVLFNFRNRDTDAARLLHDLLRRGAVRGSNARLATELTLGVLRNRARLDAMLQNMTRRPWRYTPPLVRDILRLGAYQLLFMEKIPAHAAVNETVELARRWTTRGLAAMVNAILHRLADGGPPVCFDSPPPREQWPQYYSHPAWLIRYLCAHYPEDQVAALLQWDNQTPALMLRANRLKTTAEQLAERLEADGLEVLRVGWPAPESITVAPPFGDVSSADWHKEGLATVQDGAAQLISRFVNPRCGERIVDWCSAPGGKTTHLAELTDDKASILALDVDPSRLAEVAVQVERLGIKSVRTYPLRPELIDWLAQNPAQAVLVDVPCTGLGTMQRHPDIRWRRREKDLERSARLQLEILEAAARAVAPGGRLIYSTCTLGPIENERVVEQFLERNKRFERLHAPSDVDPVVRPFLDERGDLRTWPPQHNVDAFYAARLVRKC